MESSLLPRWGSTFVSPETFRRIQGAVRRRIRGKAHYVSGAGSRSYHKTAEPVCSSAAATGCKLSLPAPILGFYPRFRSFPRAGGLILWNQAPARRHRARPIVGLTLRNQYPKARFSPLGWIRARFLGLTAALSFLPKRIARFRHVFWVNGGGVRLRRHSRVTAGFHPAPAKGDDPLWKPLCCRVGAALSFRQKRSTGLRFAFPS